MKGGNSGAGGISPRKCEICGEELNLYTCASIQWTGPVDCSKDIVEIDMLCQTCFLLMRSQFITFRQQFREEDNQ